MSTVPSAESLILCYDGSENAGHAIKRAGELLRARVAVVLTVWQPVATMGSFAWAGAMGGVADFTELDRAAVEINNRIAQQGVGIARDAGFQAEPLAVQSAGATWRTILGVAQDQGAAVIVMGSRGLTGVRSALMGSVSSAVVHHTDLPTLIIHHPTVQPQRADG
jgi:nucleotide-binding universal stress UspA family protein